MPLGMDVGDFVLDGEPVPPPRQKGGAPKFSAHVYCGQTAGWIKMPLGMEVGLGYATLCSMWTQLLPSNFWPMSIVATVACLSYC